MKQQNITGLDLLAEFNHWTPESDATRQSIEKDMDTPMLDTPEDVEELRRDPEKPLATGESSVMAARIGMNTVRSKTSPVTPEIPSRSQNDQPLVTTGALNTDCVPSNTYQSLFQHDCGPPGCSLAQGSTASETETPTLKDVMEGIKALRVDHEQTNRSFIEIMTAANVSVDRADAKTPYDKPTNRLHTLSAKVSKESLMEPLQECLKECLPKHLEQLTRELEILKNTHNLSAAKGRFQKKAQQAEKENKDLKAKNLQVSRNNQALQRSLDEALSEAENAQAELAELASLENEWNQEKSQLKAQLREANDRALQEHNARESAENRADEEAYAKASAEEKLRTTQTQLVRLQRAQKKTFEQHAKVSDSEIETMWRQLAFNIGQLADALARHLPANVQLQDFTHQSLGEIVQCYREILMDPPSSRILLQAWIWRAADRYTRPKGTALASSARKLEDVRLEMLGKARLEEAAFFASWFADGWKRLDLVLTDAKKGPHTDAIAEFKMLLDFVASPELTETMVQQLEGGLVSIFRDAQEFNTVLGSSKAVFKRSYPSCGELFEAESMEIAGYGGSPSPSSKVLFCVSPQITKYGNADGQSHDSRMVLLKAAVVVRDGNEDPEDSKMEFFV